MFCFEIFLIVKSKKNLVTSSLHIHNINCFLYFFFIQYLYEVFVKLLLKMAHSNHFWRFYKVVCILKTKKNFVLVFVPNEMQSFTKRSAQYRLNLKNFRNPSCQQRNQTLGYLHKSTLTAHTHPFP